MTRLKFKHNLKQHSLVFKLVKDLMNKIKEIENWEVLKLDPDLIYSVATSVEEDVSKSKIKGVSKKDLVLEVFKMTYELSEEDIGILLKVLEYQLNNKLIKKKTILKKGCKWLKGLVFTPSDN